MIYGPYFQLSPQTPRLLGNCIRFAHPIESGHTARLNDLKKLIHPLLLRRLKEDVVFDLPPKIEVNEFVSLSTFERDTYNQLRTQLNESFMKILNKQSFGFIIITMASLLSPALVLESASNHSNKLDRRLGVHNLHQNKRKVLVFSQFVRLLKLFREQLLKANIDFCYLDGASSSQHRQDEIDRFQNTDVSLFLISLKAGEVVSI